MNIEKKGKINLNITLAAGMSTKIFFFCLEIENKNCGGGTKFQKGGKIHR